MPKDDKDTGTDQADSQAEEEAPEPVELDGNKIAWLAQHYGIPKGLDLVAEDPFIIENPAWEDGGDDKDRYLYRPSVDAAPPPSLDSAKSEAADGGAAHDGGGDSSDSVGVASGGEGQYMTMADFQKFMDERDKKREAARPKVIRRTNVSNITGSPKAKPKLKKAGEYTQDELKALSDDELRQVVEGERQAQAERLGRPYKPLPV